jgi:pimeloyl-ACP methyl ester carboxylesterase
MIAVSASQPDEPGGRPAIVLVHGAANSAGVWTHWQRELADRGWGSYAVDLRGHGSSDPIDLSETTMADYADDVRAVMQQLASRPVVMGWSMGGLVAMMAAAAGEAVACVALAPSPPARAFDGSVELRRGIYGPERYGITSRDPARQRAMRDLDLEEREIALASLGDESQRARDDRKAGVVIESLPCLLLIVTGTNDRQWPRSTYDGLHLPAEHIEVEGASHWGLVLSRPALRELVPKVVRWLEERLAA